MMKHSIRTGFARTLMFCAGLVALPVLVQGATVDDLLRDYAAQGAGPFDAAAGGAMWKQTFTAKDGKPRSCTTCHGDTLREAGRHAVTGKAIEPLAPSVLPSRLQDRAEIEKWFLRNCRWTLGRVCTAQEKGDFLQFMAAQ